jgi:hypothetical protein
MLNNNDNTMKNMDSLTAALGNAEIDPKGIIAQMNELTQQLCRSTLEDLINSTDPLKEKALTQEEQAVLTKYGWYLDHSGEDLADIKPPTNEHDLEILGSTSQLSSGSATRLAMDGTCCFRLKLIRTFHAGFLAMRSTKFSKMLTLR